MAGVSAVNPFFWLFSRQIRHKPAGTINWINSGNIGVGKAPEYWQTFFWLPKYYFRFLKTYSGFFGMIMMKSFPRITGWVLIVAPSPMICLLPQLPRLKLLFGMGKSSSLLYFPVINRIEWKYTNSAYWLYQFFDILTC